ncbi:hypothetical protein DITRI_Ditri09bG0098000 [Diplodiscus trichospermus]
MIKVIEDNQNTEAQSSAYKYCTLRPISSNVQHTSSENFSRALGKLSRVSHKNPPKDHSFTASLQPNKPTEERL